MFGMSEVCGWLVNDNCIFIIYIVKFQFYFIIYSFSVKYLLWGQ